MSKKALLIILDGWGIGDHKKDDVIYVTGQFRSRPPQHRCRTHRLPRPGENQPCVRRRQHTEKPRSNSRLLLRQRTRKEYSLHGPDIGRRRTLFARPPLQAVRHSPRIRTARTHLHTLLHGRSRHRPQERQGLHRATATTLPADGRPHRFQPWTGTNVGNASSKPTNCW